MAIVSHQVNGEWEDWEIQSQSNPNTIYLISLDHDEDTIRCDCPDFHYRKENLRFGGVKLNDNDNHCKHIREDLNGI